MFCDRQHRSLGRDSGQLAAFPCESLTCIVVVVHLYRQTAQIQRLGICVVRHTFCRVAVLGMLVDTLGHKGVAVLIVFMVTGGSLCTFGVAAVGDVLRVMLTQTCGNCWGSTANTFSGRVENTIAAANTKAAIRFRCFIFILLFLAFIY